MMVRQQAEVRGRINLGEIMSAEAEKRAVSRLVLAFIVVSGAMFTLYMLCFYTPPKPSSSDPPPANLTAVHDSRDDNAAHDGN